MYGGSARNGFGLGLVVGICLTLIFCLSTSLGGQVLAQTQNTMDQASDQSEGLELDGVISTSEDTLANWLVAIFSALAVILIWRTLHHTKIAAAHTEGMLRQAELTTIAANLATKAAEDANAQAAKAGEQARHLSELDARAYLAVRDVKLLAPKEEDVAFVEFSIQNVGKSPAHNISAIKFVFSDDGTSLGRFEGKIPGGSQEFPLIATLVPSASEVCKVPVFLDQTYDSKLREVAGGTALRTEVMVAYQTVFDRPRRQYSGEVALVVEIDRDDFESVEVFGEIPVETFSASHRPSWMDGYLDYMEATYDRRLFEQFEGRRR